MDIEKWLEDAGQAARWPDRCALTKSSDRSSEQARCQSTRLDGTRKLPRKHSTESLLSEQIALGGQRTSIVPDYTRVSPSKEAQKGRDAYKILSKPSRDAPLDKYARKPRRKTRASLYDVKPRSQVKTTLRGHPEQGSGKRKSNATSSRRDGKKRSIAVSGNKAQNIASDRLTLRRSQNGPGLFRRGRASSPFRARGVPDLSFSEMTFLKRSNDFLEVETPPNTSHKHKAKGNPHATEDDISAYFTSRPRRTALAQLSGSIQNIAAPCQGKRGKGSCKTIEPTNSISAPSIEAVRESRHKRLRATSKMDTRQSNNRNSTQQVPSATLRSDSVTTSYLPWSVSNRDVDQRRLLSPDTPALKYRAYVNSEQVSASQLGAEEKISLGNPSSSGRPTSNAAESRSLYPRLRQAIPSPANVERTHTTLIASTTPELKASSSVQHVRPRFQGKRISQDRRHWRGSNAVLWDQRRHEEADEHSSHYCDGVGFTGNTTNDAAWDTQRAQASYAKEVYDLFEAPMGQISRSEHRIASQQICNYTNPNRYAQDLGLDMDTADVLADCDAFRGLYEPMDFGKRTRPHCPNLRPVYSGYSDFHEFTYDDYEPLNEGYDMTYPGDDWDSPWLDARHPSQLFDSAKLTTTMLSDGQGEPRRLLMQREQRVPVPHSIERRQLSSEAQSGSRWQSHRLY